MKPKFWHNRWSQKDIGFHESKPNIFLTDYFEKLDLFENSRIFVPLCGKTLDIGWMLSQGFKVVGVELSETAIDELFEELNVKPTIHKQDEFLCYCAENITIFVGDFFKLTSELLGKVDAIYDRAALVALPDDMRERYAKHLQYISNCAPQLLITFEYDQNAMNGPPFSVDTKNVEHHYVAAYDIAALERKFLEKGLRGVTAQETAWLLTPLK